ncbi:MAG: hypothetical protein AB7S26_16930 [Sandaracinaceae bacterium]
MCGVFAVLSGCALNPSLPPTGNSSRPPRLAALSVYAAPIGTPVQLYGSDFTADASYVAVFDGSYDTAEGSEAVSLRQDLDYVDAGVLEWRHFGPHDLPFSTRGARVGTFYGTVTIVREMPDGEPELASDPLDVTFDVLPSLLVHEFQPITANCAEPADRALGGGAYRLRVEAIGIEPVNFTYTLATPDLAGSEPIVERHLAQGRFDTIGERGDFVLPTVPSDTQAYDAVFVIEALDANGGAVRNAFAVGVHRPIEVYYNGNIEVAEILAPEPVSACTPGGEAGRQVSYNETQTETRTRTFDVSWNQSWRTDHTVSVGSSETVGASASNGVGYGISDGQSVTWEFGGKAEIALSEAVKLGFSGSRSQTDSHTESVERNATEGVSRSETTTNTESRTNSESVGAAEGFAWSVSSSESIARGFGGTVIAGTYGVFYRQAVRMLRRAVVVTINQCGATEVVGEVSFNDWTWAADLALGDSCPPFPTSNLPEAECLLPPCGG